MYPTRVLITLATLIAIATGFVTVLIVTQNVTVDSTPIIVTVLGFIGLIVNNLVTGAKTDAKVEKVDEKVGQILNGKMDDKVRAVVRSELSAAIPRFRIIVNQELTKILEPHK